MASTSRTIEIVFGATDKTGDAFRSVGDGLESMENRIGSVTGPLADVSSIILTTEAALAGLGAAFLGFAYNESVKFEAAALDLQKVLSDSEGSVEQYTPKVRELASAYGVASTFTLQAAADFRQAGFNIEESLSLTETSLQAVKISELEASQASELLVRTLSGFQAPASEAGRLLDILNAVSNEYAASVGELGAGMAELSPIAAKAGLTFEETAGLLTPIIEVFGSGSESARAMKTALLRLGSDTKPVQTALTALGVAQTDANGAFRQTGDILADLAGVFPDLTDAQQTYYAAELFGIDQAAKVTAALGNYEKVLGATDVALNSAGSAQKELAVRMQAAEEVINRTKVALTGVAQAIGAQFHTEMTRSVDATGELARVFRTIVDDGGLEPLFNVLRPLLSGFEEDVRAIAKAMPEAFGQLQFDPVVDGLEEVGRTISAIFDGVDLTTPEGLASAMQKVVNVGGGLLQVTAGIIEGLTPLINGLAAAAGGFGDLDKETQQAGGNLLGIAQSIDLLLPAVGGLGTGLNTLGVGLTSIATTSALKTITGLSGGFGVLAASIGTVTAGLAVFATTYSIGKLFGDWAFGMNAAEEAAAGLAEKQGIIAEKLKEVSASTGLTIKSIDQLNKLVDEGTVYLSKMTGEWESVDQETIRLQKHLKELTGEVEDVSEGFQELKLEDLNEQVKTHGLAWASTSGHLVQAAHSEEEIELILNRMYGVLDDGADKFTEFNSSIIATRQEGDLTVKTLQAADGSIKIITERAEDAADSTQGFSQAMVAGATSAEDLAQKVGLSSKEAASLYVELEKLATNRDIALIEAKVQLDIASLEQDTARFEAIFESINTTIDSTGNLIGDLFGHINDAGSLRDKLNIEEQIELENQRRQEALDIQKKAAEAEIAYLRKKTEALARGDALIKIEADGMEPEIEAFMWKILENIQVRANADSEEFLLNVAGAV